MLLELLRCTVLVMVLTVTFSFVFTGTFSPTIRRPLDLLWPALAFAAALARELARSSLPAPSGAERGPGAPGRGEFHSDVMAYAEGRMPLDDVVERWRRTQ